MASDAPDLQQAWKDACAEFKEATGFDIAAGSDSPNGEDIVNKFKAYKAKDEEGEERLNKAKTAVKNTLIAVERIGQVAAQGASMVFGGPASLTMNCISFLIDAGVAYRNIAHNIHELFSRIATIMERFQIYRAYEEIMHPAMIRVAHQLLVAVVAICAKCIAVLNKNAFFKILKVAAFDSDGGIKSQFGVLTALEAQELQMKSTLTLVATETSKRDNVAGFEQLKANGMEISKSVSQLSASSSEKATLEELKQKLDMDDSSSKEAYRQYQNKVASGSNPCAWIKDDSQYRSWSDIASVNQDPLMIIQGDEDTGKSYAMTAIIRDLLIRHPQGQHTSNRVSVAYHYLTRGGRREDPSSKSGSAIKSGPSIRDAVKSWAWQAINNDLFYRKDIVAMFKKENDLGDLLEYWQKLFLSHIETGATFFLLLDGIHELDNQEISNLISVLQSLTKVNSGLGRIKIMITSRVSLSLKLCAKLFYDIVKLDIIKKTRTDMEAFIQRKADDLPIFQKKTEQVQALKERVCTGLSDAVNGSFLLAHVKLQEIATKHDPEEVMQVVENAASGSTISDSILEDIRECNRTLTAREMHNLNTLLLWTIHGEVSFLVKELEAILFIQNGRTSLQPLEYDIRDKYSAFFTMDGDEDLQSACVQLKYDSIADYFVTASKEKIAQDASTDQALSKAEVQIVQNLFEKLCDPELYGKLGLKAFFDQKLSQSNMTVGVDCENAHAKIALTCLRVLTGEFSDEADCLTWYSGYGLPRHLEKIDADNVDPRNKAELGPRLVAFFTQPGPVEKSTGYSWVPWSYNDSGVDQVLRLLRSSAVMKKIAGVDEEKQAWVEAVLTDAHPEIALLKDIAKTSAEFWLSSEDATKAVCSFEWLFGYLNKIECKDHSDVERLEEAPQLNTISTQSIEDVLDLAIGLHSSELTQPIVLRNIGVTYLNCDNIAEAIEWFNRALAVNAEFTLAHRGLAVAYSTEINGGPEPDWEKALSHCDLIISNCKAGKAVFSGKDPDSEVGEYYGWRAQWLRKLCRYEEACAIYTNLLQKDPTDDAIRLELIYTFYELRMYEKVVEMLQELHKEIDEDTRKTTLLRFFRANGNDHACHHTLVQAFKEIGRLSEIKSHYRNVVEDFKLENTKDFYTAFTRWNITYRYAALLYTQADAAHERSEAVEVWEHIVTQVSAEHKYMEPVMLSAKRLARMYIEKAIEAGSGSIVAQEMLAKVRAFGPEHGGIGEVNEDAKGMGLTPAEVRALVGRYYSAVGELDQARNELRPTIDVGIKLLSDEDPENDWQGYVKLADGLMDFGDDAGAIAAWCMIQPTEGLPVIPTSADADSSSLPDANTSSEAQEAGVPNGHALEPSTQADVKIDDSSNGSTSDDAAPFQAPPLRRANTSRLTMPRAMQGPLLYSCDGRCGRSWQYADDIHVCRQCVDVQFDAPCLEKLRKGDLGRDICDPTHTFIHVPAWDIESLKRAQSGKVLVGEQVMEVSAWLEGIKREWGLTDA